MRALLLWCLLMVIFPGGDAAALSAALVEPGTGLTITGMTISGNTLVGPNTQSWGTYTNASGVYGMTTPGVIISTGKVSDYGDSPSTVPFQTTNYGTDATAAQRALLAPIGGALLSYHDVTQIDVQFVLNAAYDGIIFNVVFGSEEWPDFVGFGFNDAFGLYVNGVNIAFSGGLPINIDHPDFAAILGTELNGVLAPGSVPMLTFTRIIGRGESGTLTLIIADQSDGNLDSTAYISGLGQRALGVLASPVNAGGKRRLKCVSSVQESPMVDWASLQRKLEKERPQPLPETRWKG